MSFDLAVPDPRKEMVPAGWFEETAMPAVEEMTEWDELDAAEAQLKMVASIVESFGADGLEFTKALRLVEKRRGDLLGPTQQGKRTDLQPLTRVLEVDISPMTASRYRQLARYWDKLLPVVLTATKTAQISQRRLLKIIDEINPVETQLPDIGDERSDNWTMLFGDMRERLNELEDGSIDMIFTDPPYPKDYLPLYGDLADQAARLLKPRGVLATYAGVLFLPDVLDLLHRSGLTYGWTFSLSMPEAGQSRIMGRHVIQGWKPLIVMTNGTWTSGPWIQDPLYHPPNKERYSWEQDPGVASVVVERFTRPGEIVLDPFMGTGTAGEAALRLDRKIIGVEADQGRFEMSTKRLRDAT